MKLQKDIELIDLSLYTQKTLILTDFHIGYEEALNKQGIFVPRFQFKDIIARLDKIFEKFKKKSIETIVIAGDLKHEFGSISNQEWRHTLKLIDYLSKRCQNIVLLRGNHDKILGPIARKRNVTVADYLLMQDNERYIYEIERPDKELKHKNKTQTQLLVIKKTLLNTIKKTHSKNISIKKKSTKKSKNSILVVHGDRIPGLDILKDVKTIIMGHEHPAIRIHDTRRSEKFKCFLIGKYQKKNLIVIPSFNLVTEGSDITKDRLLSPFLKQDLENFKAVVVSDKLYDFGKLKDLAK